MPRHVAILNAESGTLKTTDLDDYCQRIRATFAEAGKELDCRVVAGKELAASLEAAFNDDRSQAVIVAGGDGTLSTAVDLAWKSGKPMGIIPAGTLNLFARSLGMPMEIGAAAEALAAGTVARADVATANGLTFAHHFSVGFQPRLVLTREKRRFDSRLGKIAASIGAALDTIRRPPSFPAELSVDGRRTSLRLSSLTVSNNPFGEGHLPYADELTTGTLGVYYVRPVGNAANVRMLADLALGTWCANPDVAEARGSQVRLSFPRKHRRARAALDGELVDLPDVVEIDIHPGAVQILRPAG